MVLLLGAMVFVNGWTDAPNAIATCVGCGAMKMRTASLMAAIMNLLGTVVGVVFSGAVMSGMMNIVTVDDANAKLTISVAMLTVVIWAVVAWYFGLPTSESHSLVSALSGAALAVAGSISSHEWQKVMIGLLLSVALGGGAGSVFALLGKQICIREKETKTAVKIASSLMAFSHGAGDGQKFVGVFLLILSPYAKNENELKTVAVITVSLLMFLGTSLGGERIIKTVAKEMTTLDPKTALLADLGGATCVLVSTFFGIPISTTHSKMTSVMGVASVNGNLNFGSVRKMFIAWALTFPVSFVLAYLLTWLLK